MNKKIKILVSIVFAFLLVIFSSTVFATGEYSIEQHLLDNGYDTNGDNILSLEELDRITELNLTYINMPVDLKEINIKSINKLQNLKTLHIWNYNLTKLDIQPITELINLTSLTIWCNSIKELDTDAIGNLKKLNKLDIECQSILQFDTKPLSTLTDLTELRIECSKIQNLDTEPLKNLNNLTSLGIYCNSLAELKLEPLKNLNNLTSLSIRSYKITKLDMDSIAELENLTLLFIYGDAITELDLKCLLKLTKLLNLTIKTEKMDIKIIETNEKVIKTIKDAILKYGTITFDESILNIKEFENVKLLNGFDLGQMGTKVEDFIKSFETATDYDIQIVDRYGSDMANDKLIGTGANILLVDGDEIVDFYTVIYYGDVDGNGTINAIDALAIVKNKNGQIPFLDEVYEEAGRITGEAEVPSAVDALAIVKHKTGKYIINQKHESAFKFFPSDYIWAVG